jgi:hypothetical protein
LVTQKEDEDSTYQLVGIVSNGFTSETVAFTRVSHFHAWILDTIGNN